MSTIVFRLLIPAALALGLVGCAADAPAEPEPQFSNESEAFAAAEATYRAYVDALNQVDLSDPETFEAVYAWTTGELNASDRTGFSAWHADGWTLIGDAEVLTVEPYETTPQVSVGACYFVGNVDVLDAEGTSVVGADRPTTQELVITFESSRASPTGLLLEHIGPNEAGAGC